MTIDWQHFTPWTSLAGGLLIGTAASLLILAMGRIMGVSGIVGGMLTAAREAVGWRAAFVLGLLVTPFFLRLVTTPQAPRLDTNWLTIAIAGLLVGFGTRLGSGCTSGHGVCGLSRFSTRSIVATAVFMAAGFATTFIVRHLIA
jgi:uncharacterized protein